MLTRLTALRESPIALPAGVAMVLFFVWATSEAGYPLTHWAPGALLLLGLLWVAVLALGRPTRVPIATRVALVCLAAYTAFSFLTIAWAGVPGDAWEGADRTLLYLIVFALFACWPLRAPSAALLVAGWTVAMAVLAGVVLAHLDGASHAELQKLVPGGRLDYPSGYPNANAAQWLMAFWSAVLLARTPTLPSWLRGLLIASAVLLADVALLSQSRGSFYAAPVLLIVVLATVPGRLRTLSALVPVAAGLAASVVSVLAVGDDLLAGEVVTERVHTAVWVSLAAAAGAGIAVAVLSRYGPRAGMLPASSRIWLRRRGRALTGAAVVALVAVALVLVGNPVRRVEHAWDSFKGGYAQNASTGSRLVGGLGSNRYDFYRVALDEFISHPIGGIGVDNFQESYLQHGRSDETPRYPHSVELRALAETGIVGTVLLLVALVAACAAAWRAMRGRDELARSVAAAAFVAFAYWFVHGSFDWFWEFAGLGAPAFALLGLSVGLARSELSEIAVAEAEHVREERPASGGFRVGRHAGVVAIAAVATAAAALALVAPWASRLDVQHAARTWTANPAAAYRELEQAAKLDPLSSEPLVVEGTIATRYDELTRADRAFASALSRTPGDVYATLEAGAIASASGRAARAVTLLERAVRLSPRYATARQALGLVRSGRRIDVEQLNRQIFLEAQPLA